jgi:broad specificity phosphatase PhoE
VAGHGGEAPVHLARHGQTAYNAEPRFQGQLDNPLDATGRAQAHELADLVAGRPWAALYASPLARAAETAGIVAERIGLTPSFDRRFAETDAGDWTDRRFADVEREDPDGLARFLARDPAWRFPGGESFEEQRERVRAGLRDVEAGPLPALVVCHGMTIRVALAALHGWDAMRLEVPNAALVPWA